MTWLQCTRQEAPIPRPDARLLLCLWQLFRTTRLCRKHRLGIPGASVSPPGRPLRPSAQPAGVPLKPGDCAPPRSLAALGPRLCLFRPGAAHLRTVAHHVSAEHGRTARPEAAPLSVPRGTSPRSVPRCFRGKRNGSTARGCASIGLTPRRLCTVRGCASVGPDVTPALCELNHPAWALPGLCLRAERTG